MRRTSSCRLANHWPPASQAKISQSNEVKLCNHLKWLRGFHLAKLGPTEIEEQLLKCLKYQHLLNFLSCWKKDFSAQRENFCLWEILGCQNGRLPSLCDDVLMWTVTGKKRRASNEPSTALKMWAHYLVDWIMESLIRKPEGVTCDPHFVEVPSNPQEWRS